MWPATQDRTGSGFCVVAIPVRNERARIIGCLEALADQVEVPSAGLGILLFLNNCDDGTRGVVDHWVARSPWPIRIIERNYQSASAGWARRQAMEAAATWLEQAGMVDGILLTTDADTIVPATWVSGNASVIAAGADAVAGRIAFHPDEMAVLSFGVRKRQRLESEYRCLLAEIEARLDPQLGNPWPCHRTKSGASIAVKLTAFRQVGGIPLRESGEDHAFIDRLSACGLLVRFAPDIIVMTSGRLDGRAKGGTAETLRGWSENPASLCDAQLERVGSLVVKVLRRRIRGRLTPTAAKAVVRRPLRPRDLTRQIKRARLLLRFIQPLEARRAGMPSFAPCSSREMPEQPSLP